MNKGKLMCAIARFEKEVRERLEFVRREVNFNSDLVLLKEKHKKFCGEDAKELNELKVRQRTLAEVLNGLNEILEDEDIDIETIRKNV